jgi:hypothetical protein
MAEEYMGMRLAYPSGGSLKVVIPPKVVEDVWNKIVGTEQLIPICFIRSGSNIIIAHAEKVMENYKKNSDIIKKVNDDWGYYAFKQVIRKERENEIDFLEGKITEQAYLMNRQKYWDPYHHLSKRFRKISGRDTLQFGSFSDKQDFSEIISFLSENDKQERFLELLEEVKIMIKERASTQELILKVKNRMNKNGMNKALGESLALNLSQELDYLDKRLQCLKQVMDQNR